MTSSLKKVKLTNLELFLDTHRREMDQARLIREEMEEKLERERRNAENRVKESEQRAYEKAKREFELETKI